MSSLTFFTPSTVDEAVELLSASPTPLDSPTHHRLRTDLHLLHAFAQGRRRPEWVWAAREDDGTAAPRTVGVVAALGSPGGAANVLDHFGLPADTDHARALLRHATRAARAVGVEEAVVFAPAGHTLDSVAARPLAGALAAAGWRLLVIRRHYEFEPAAGLAEGLSTGLRFERLVAADDPRLAEVHRQVMDETLDEHQRSLISRMGFDAACDAALQGLLEADPVDCIRLAIDDTGAAVGMVSGLTVSTGRGFVLFVGVAREHRGRGYGRQLLAWMTRELLAEGALTLIADTDHDNVPMGAAFEAVGWPQTETRIDLVPDVPS